MVSSESVFAIAQAALELLHRGREDEDEHRVGVLALDGLPALDVDVEDGDAVIGCAPLHHRLRAAVEMAVDLGPLDELAAARCALEGVIDEVVLDPVLLGPRATGWCR